MRVSCRRDGTHGTSLTPESLATIVEVVEENAAHTLKEMKERLSLHSMNLSITTIHRELVQLKITLKRAAKEPINLELAVEQRK